MVNDIDNPATFAILWEVVGAIENEAGVPHGDPPLDLPVERSLRLEWTTLLHNYLMAVSYYRGIQGVLLRAKLARVLDPETVERRAETINGRMHRSPPLRAPVYSNV
jgi:hypothetical protein